MNDTINASGWFFLWGIICFALGGTFAVLIRSFAPIIAGVILLVVGGIIGLLCREKDY